MTDTYYYEDTLRIADEYMSLGYPCFLTNENKRGIFSCPYHVPYSQCPDWRRDDPLTCLGHGHVCATTDTDEMIEIIKRASGIRTKFYVAISLQWTTAWVLDIDAHDTDGVKGIDIFETKCVENTCDMLGYSVQATRSNGLHFVFMRPSINTVFRGTLGGESGIDVKANGFICADPRLGYEWLTSLVPISQLARAPEWVETLAINSESPSYPSTANRKYATSRDVAKNVIDSAVDIITEAWPPSGRHDAALALAGVLLANAGLTVPVVEEIVRRVAEHTGSTSTSTKVACVARTRALLDAGKRAKGIPSLVKSLGKTTVKKLLELFVIDDNDEEENDAIDEIALCDVFVKKHKEDLKYCADYGGWFIWDGHYWSKDRSFKALNLTHNVISDEVVNPKQRTTNVIWAVNKQATISPVFATESKSWDIDPWILNTPDGIVNLRTGDIRPHCRDDLVTKSTAVGPSVLPTPTWSNFLAQATLGDKDLQLFLQQLAGYALTGDTSEQQMFFFWGPGRNGKGVFFHTIQNILKGYAKDCPPETLMETTGSRHSTELARLTKTRLVTSTEIPGGAAWNESRIKSMTGGDMMTAHFMRQDYFTYKPEFKLWISGQNKPTLRNVDAAIMNRINMIEFKFKPIVLDTKLEDKIMLEARGILQWAIEGCLSWQNKGLLKPISVRSSTHEYFEGEDMIQEFIDACCVVGPEHKDSVDTLWNAWCIRNPRSAYGINSRRSLGDKLIAKGFSRIRSSNNRGIVGLKVKK